MVIFLLSRSLEVIVLFTQLRVPADFPKGRLLKEFLTKRFSKLIRKNTLNFFPSTRFALIVALTPRCACPFSRQRERTGPTWNLKSNVKSFESRSNFALEDFTNHGGCTLNTSQCQ